MHNGRFHKMHGLGNDFVIVDARGEAFAPSPAMAAAIADRHQGIGCGQLIVLESSKHAFLKMRIYNADGSEAGACGNATRCVSSLLLAEKENRGLEKRREGSRKKELLV